ncbi:MAG: hypothetical protein PVJ49_13070 [Acidobacteriota bacterium]|jgi:hypothetical protein
MRLEKDESQPALEAIRLKIGSDPDKAPRRINRWGAATEVGESRHVFEASINSIDPKVTLSSVLPIVSPVDFQIRQVELLVGTTGALRGAPVRITYQPNFWLRAFLNLHGVSTGRVRVASR